MGLLSVPLNPMRKKCKYRIIVGLQIKTIFSGTCKLTSSMSSCNSHRFNISVKLTNCTAFEKHDIRTVKIYPETDRSSRLEIHIEPRCHCECEGNTKFDGTDVVPSDEHSADVSYFCYGRYQCSQLTLSCRKKFDETLCFCRKVQRMMPKSIATAKGSLSVASVSAMEIILEGTASATRRIGAGVVPTRIALAVAQMNFAPNSNFLSILPL